MILVTGGTGLVGSHLLFELVKKGEQVRALCRSARSTKKTLKIFSYYSANAQELFDLIDFAEGDVTDKASVQQACEGVDEIFHCAAYVSFNPADHDTIMATNHGGTANVVDICLDSGIKKLHYISSIASLGNATGSEEVSETTEWKEGETHSSYSLSKLEAEKEIFRGIAAGLDVCLVNPAVILGAAGDWTSGSAAFFPTLWKGLKYYPPGTIACVDVRDVVAILLKLRDEKIYGERFILVSENLSFKDFFTMIADSIGRPRPTKALKPFIGNLAWRLEKFRSKITGNAPLITKDSIRSGFDTTRYSNKKLSAFIDYVYIPVEKSVKDIGQMFLKEM